MSSFYKWGKWSTGQFIADLGMAKLGFKASFPPASGVFIRIFIPSRTSLNELILKDKFQIEGN